MRAERREIRDLLGQLTPAQWRTASLCAGWTVRDVASHLVAWDELLLYRTRREHAVVLTRFVALYATSFASMKLLNHRLQRRTRHLDPDALARQFAADDGADLKWLFDGTNPGAHLAEYVIHHEDIRRPLGLRGTVPPDRLTAALEGVTQLPGLRVSAWWRLRRTRLEASDINWGRGRGQVQRTTGSAALIWLAGRAA
jgi:uncharacterized protein (TIGR03083 family)